MRIFLFILTLIVAFPAGAEPRTEGIAAVVNQDAISMTDLNDRLHLVIASSGLPPSKEMQQRLTVQVLNELIEEQLKMQEAQRLEIQVSSEEVQKGFEMVANQNRLTLDQFKSAMRNDGINPATLERQIRAQIGWSKVIQKTMRPKVIVTDGDIEEFSARLQKAKGKSQYHVAEIFLPVGEDSPEADAQQLANRLVKEITSGKATFSKIAQQFSGGAGAARGGDLGWVGQGQLQPEIEQALNGLQKEGVSNPVRTADGYHILLLRDVRTVNDETMPARDDILNRIGVDRLERMQARQLLELKTTAFIENRVES